MLPKLARGADIPVQSGAATARLQALLNEGPLEMIGSRADMTDRYGPDLRTILRDGRLIAEQLRGKRAGAAVSGLSDAVVLNALRLRVSQLQANDLRADP